MKATGRDAVPSVPCCLMSVGTLSPSRTRRCAGEEMTASARPVSLTAPRSFPMCHTADLRQRSAHRARITT